MRASIPTVLTPAALLAVLLTPLLALIFGMGCSTPSRSLRVLQVTDVHGHYSAAPRGQPAQGLRALATLIEAERRRGPVLLVDSGDLWSGTMLSDRSEGRVGVLAYNMLGFDAVAMGNHEFDYGPIGARRVGDDQPFGALRARLQQARFPMLVANVVDRKTGQLPAWPNLRPSVVIERGGFRIGLVGAVTPVTPEITFPYVGQRLRFDDPAAALAKESQRLRVQEKVDLVFAVVHLGGKCDPVGVRDDEVGCDPQGEVNALVRRLPPGSIDAIFGGHTHTRLARRIHGIPVLQAGRHASHVAVLDVVQKDPQKNPSLTMEVPRPVPTRLRGELAKQMDTLLAPLEAELNVIRGELLGARLVRGLARNRDESSPMGAFVCGTLLRLHPEREICMVNSGGLRADLPAGDVTYGDLYDVMPFGNALAYLDVPGAVLLEIARRGTAGDHGALQTVGMTIVYDRSRDTCPNVDRDGDGKIGMGDRDRIVTVEVKGRPVEPERVYRLVSNSFIASGGDGMAAILARLPEGSVKILYEQLPVREQVVAHLRRVRPVLNSPDLPMMPRRNVTAIGTEPSARCP